MFVWLFHRNTTALEKEQKCRQQGTLGTKNLQHIEMHVATWLKVKDQKCTSTTVKADVITKISQYHNHSLQPEDYAWNGKFFACLPQP